VLDLADTTFMDSTGVGIVIRTSAIYGADAIVIRSPQARIRNLFELTGLHRHVTIISAPEDAEMTEDKPAG
jgi:anti-anti-sigma factor